MISIKAFLISVSAMIFLGLTFELIFLFIDIGYNVLLKSYPGTQVVRQPFYYVLVLVGLFFVMFTGGYLTSIYAKKYVTAHIVVAATTVCGIALYATSSGYDFTLLSILFVIISVAFALYGNIVYKKNAKEEQHPV